MSRVTDWEQVWGLHTTDGWASASSEGVEAFPLWPHPEYAKLQAQGQWQNYVPEPIELEVFLVSGCQNCKTNSFNSQSFLSEIPKQSSSPPSNCSKT
ncbi:DUF2750 domain-containing protein [Stutzerimonas stutzeri]|uniref:DUF2750 domain-containing protein n=1 Tax=Stutzerimonas stutzeri TaxID=316 RepID=UPI003C6FB0D9